jgi:hypothetical protein
LLCIAGWGDQTWRLTLANLTNLGSNFENPSLFFFTAMQLWCILCKKATVGYTETTVSFCWGKVLASRQIVTKHGPQILFKLCWWLNTWYTQSILSCSTCS